MQPLLRRKLRSLSREEEMTVVIKIDRLDFHTTFHNNAINIVCPWLPRNVRAYSSSPHVKKKKQSYFLGQALRPLRLGPCKLCSLLPEPHTQRGWGSGSLPVHVPHLKAGRPGSRTWSAGPWSPMMLSLSRAHLWPSSVWMGNLYCFIHLFFFI